MQVGNDQQALVSPEQSTRGQGLQRGGAEEEGVGQKAAPVAVFMPFCTDLVICFTVSLR